MALRAAWNRRLFVSDLLLIPVAVYLTFMLRLDRLWLDHAWSGFLCLVLPAVLLFPVVFRCCGLYSRYWAYASVDDASHLALAVWVLTLLAGAIYLTGVEPYILGVAGPPSESIVGIFYLLALSLTAVPRFALRLSHSVRLPRHDTTGLRTLIVGAGETGRRIVAELQRDPRLALDPIAFLDDDPAKRGVRIAGVPVVGGCAELTRVVAALAIERVVIAMPSAPGKVIRQLVAECEAVGIVPQTLPGLNELLDGRVQVSQLRPVQIEDLLRRAPIRTDLEEVRALLAGKRVLVTGAGGSIGSELCRQILRCQPAELVLFGHGENSIFAIQNELQRIAAHDSPTALAAFIGDIRTAARVDEVFARYQPDVVFHAGAHKHVPLMELNPSEAVSNNVFGTQNILRAAERAGSERFVLISTDKAVNPTNVMGASKRVAELLVHDAARRTGRPYLVTRFGNVLGSRGSVLLTMKEQIARGGPVTVTDPAMVRYFMTISEAVQLVLQAAVLGRGGEVLMFDMGEPVRILDLARDLIRLSGLVEGVDIGIVFSGARPGEKLFEEMFLPGETYRRTLHEQIYIAAEANRSVPEVFDRLLCSLADAITKGDEAISDALRHLVPEYVPTCTESLASSRIITRADPDPLGLIFPPGSISSLSPGLTGTQ